MVIRQDFHPQTQLPPRLYLEQVMDNLSRAYCFLWDNKNDQNILKMTWKELSIYYNKNSFRSNLRKLNKEGLLSYEELDDGISIEMIGWDEIASQL